MLNFNLQPLVYRWIFLSRVSDQWQFVKLLVIITSLLNLKIIHLCQFIDECTTNLYDFLCFSILIHWNRMELAIVVLDLSKYVSIKHSHVYSSHWYFLLTCKKIGISFQRHGFSFYINSFCQFYCLIVMSNIILTHFSKPYIQIELALSLYISVIIREESQGN